MGKNININHCREVNLFIVQPYPIRCFSCNAREIFFHFLQPFHYGIKSFELNKLVQASEIHLLAAYTSLMFLTVRTLVMTQHTIVAIIYHKCMLIATNHALCNQGFVHIWTTSDDHLTHGTNNVLAPTGDISPTA